MREVAIVNPVRTAVGRFGGSLKDLSAAEMGTKVIEAVLEQTGLDPEKIEDVILGHGYGSGEEPAIGRLCALKAGLPIEVPGCEVDRRDARYGLETMCVGGGQGMAAIFERR